MSEVILGMSACRTSVTEVYQSGPATAPLANGWGCEVSASQATKYVAGISTDVNGGVTATVTGISTSVNGSVVTLIPWSTSAAAAVFSASNSQTLWGWVCGGTGTNVPLKYLPGSCRG
jgi:type IV pilus assembly protein PilA